VLISLGQLQYETNKYELARISFKQAIEVDSLETNTLNKIGNFYLNKGEKEEANIYFQKVLNIDKSDSIEN